MKPLINLLIVSRTAEGIFAKWLPPARVKMLHCFAEIVELAHNQGLYGKHLIPSQIAHTPPKCLCLPPPSFLSLLLRQGLPLPSCSSPPSEKWEHVAHQSAGVGKSPLNFSQGLLGQDLKGPLLLQLYWWAGGRRLQRRTVCLSPSPTYADSFVSPCFLGFPSSGQEHQ